MNGTGALGWFARHELTLAWRDWAMLMSGGRKLEDHSILIGMALFAAGLHGLAWLVIGPHLETARTLSPLVLVTITGSLLLTFTMMVSQALEQVTRAFYSRDDLDLILSSPAPARPLFAVRLTSMAVTTAMMSSLVVAPFVNVAAVADHPRWLMAYAVILALALLAAALSAAITLALFRTIGPKRTRLVAQIVAAVVGASFLIGIQVVAILGFGSMSRFTVFGSDVVLGMAPNAASVLWLPARAVAGDATAALAVLAIAIVVFAIVTHAAARRFETHVVEALGVAEPQVTETRHMNVFRPVSPRRALLRKEWTLLRRDPWLVSQSLMQVLYLIPPALMLWVSYGTASNLHAIVAPIIVMAAGQLAGGLAWLSISGEDAPDLVATAPVTPGALLSAKIESVLVVVVALAAPLVLALAFVSLYGAAVTAFGVVAAAGAAILIQIWFRAQARRTGFRRRQVASKASTFAEAFASILIAATTALAATGSWLALAPALLTLIVLATARRMRPAKF